MLAGKGLVKDGPRGEDTQGNKDRIWKTLQQHDYLVRVHVALFYEAVECINLCFTLFCNDISSWYTVRDVTL